MVGQHIPNLITRPLGPRSRRRVSSIGGWRRRDNLLFKQPSQHRAGTLRHLHQLRHRLISLLVIIEQDVAIADGLEVNADVVRGDDGQCALDARMQRPSESLAHLAAQRNQAAPERAS